MKLKEAISAAFGRTQNIRRASWDDASAYFVISIFGNSRFSAHSGNKKFFDVHVGKVGKTPEETPDNLNADDWELYPKKEPKFNWRSVLSLSEDSTAREAKCELTFAGRQLKANDCILAWVVPRKLSFLVRCDDERFDGWPAANKDKLYTPLHDTPLKVRVVTQRLEQQFTVVGFERFFCGKDVRLYRFAVKTPESAPPRSEA